MRVLLVSAGSRGDFQPLLALSIALQQAGHEVVLTGGTSYASEADAFGVPYRVVGMDVKTWMADNREELEMNPVNGVYQLLKLTRSEFAAQLAGALPIARECDLVVGAGAMLAAPTIADAAGIPLRYIAYTPQVFRSRHHSPFIFPFTDLPAPLNRFLWQAAKHVTERILRNTVTSGRATLGLPGVGDLQHHIFPSGTAIVAADPDLCPVPPDVELACMPVGSFELPDTRPFPPDLEAFLAAGPPPVYIGFGSMPDPDPARTARILVDAARNAGVRAILSRGWAGFDAHADERLFVVGPVSHASLFRRCAAIVHHGGAGTTHAAARAGVPQVVVPHAFDQFQFASWTERAGVSTTRLPRTRIAWQPLAERIARATSDPALTSSARALGERMRARDPLRAAVALLERAVA